MSRTFKKSDGNRDEAINAAREKLEQMVASLSDSDTFKAWLSAQAKFHRYSFGNTLLIMGQRPDATRVKGFQGWIKLGRCVNAGEKGIRILAPRPYSKTATDKNGNEVTKSGTYFGVTHVFDYAQTSPIEGHPHPYEPRPLPIIEGDVADGVYDAAVKLAETEGLTIQTTDDRGHARSHGFYSPVDRVIFVRPNPTPHMLAVLVHEIAHHYADSSEIAKVGYGAEEVIVQSISFIVCDHLGLQTDEFSTEYIAGWSQNDPKAFERGLGFIQKTAGAIIDALEAAIDIDDAEPMAA